MTSQHGAGSAGGRGRKLLLRVEAAGRTDRFAGAPYEDLFWYEGRRAGLPWPSVWWWLQGVGVVAGAADETPLAEQTAAAAVDAVRLSLRTPQTLAQARGGPDEDVDLPKSVKRALEWANQSLLEARQGQYDRAPALGCELLCAAMRSNKAAVGWVGNCACFLVREGEAQRLTPAPPHRSEDEPDFDRTPSWLTERRSAERELLGVDQRIEPHIVDLETEVGDVLILLSSGIAERLSSDEELGDLVERTGSVEEACERLLVEARIRGSEGTNSIVMLAVALDRSGRVLTDPARDPLAFPAALRAAALPPTAHIGAIEGVHELLGLEAPIAVPENMQLPAPVDEAPPEAVVEPGPERERPTEGEPEAAAAEIVSGALVAEGPAPEADTAEEEVVPSQPEEPEPEPEPAPEAAPAETTTIPPAAVGVAPRTRKRRLPRWVLAALAVVMIAGGLVVWQVLTGWEQWDSLMAALVPESDTDGVGSPARASLTARAASSTPSLLDLPVPEAIGDEYLFQAEPAADSLVVSLNADAPGPVEIILQVFRNDQPREVFREQVRPGDRVAVGVPSAAAEPWLFRKEGLRLGFRIGDDGMATWAPSAQQSLPEAPALRFEGSRVYLRQSRSRTVLVFRLLAMESPIANGGEVVEF